MLLTAIPERFIFLFRTYVIQLNFLFSFLKLKLKHSSKCLYILAIRQYLQGLLEISPNGTSTHVSLYCLVQKHHWVCVVFKVSTKLNHVLSYLVGMYTFAPYPKARYWPSKYTCRHICELNKWRYYIQIISLKINSSESLAPGDSINCSGILFVNSKSGPITCYENNKNYLYSTTFNIVNFYTQLSCI
jgi:hypothetical protein